jgi:hypothetical protein
MVRLPVLVVLVAVVSKDDMAKINHERKAYPTPDTEILDRCRYEADVHRAVLDNSASATANGTTSQQQQQLRQYVMPLYGFTIQQQDCYMFFPLSTECGQS